MLYVFICRDGVGMGEKSKAKKNLLLRNAIFKNASNHWCTTALVLGIKTRRRQVESWLVQKLTHWGRHFEAAVFQTIFSNGFPRMKIYEMSIKFSLKYVPSGPINNIPALVETISWRRLGDKRLSEPMMAWFTGAYMCHSAVYTDIFLPICAEMRIVSCYWQMLHQPDQTLRKTVIHVISMAYN